MINWRKRERDRIPIGTETPKVEIVFKMVLSTDISSPAPGKSVSCQISKNGSAFFVAILKDGVISTPGLPLHKREISKKLSVPER